MYELLAICLSLAGLLTINTATMVLAAILWRVCSESAESWRPMVRARFLYLLRIAPGTAAVLCVGTLFLPAYLSHEPRYTTEIVTAKLGILAALSLYAIGFALWRGFTTCLVTRRLVKDWLKHAAPVLIENVTVPAYRFEHPFPVIAIVGALRPRLFIADQIFQSFSREEMAAAVAHENGHLLARDNIKRGLLRCCRDMLPIVPLGRALDRAWITAAELAADEYAARGGASAALNLASALVKVARLAPRGCRPTLLVGASLISQDLSHISTRVLRLTQLAAQSNQVPDTACRLPGFAIGAGLLCLLISSFVMIYSTNSLFVIHSAMERVVSIFQ
jgi:Zn-dependent protease with chaperone function